MQSEDFDRIELLRQAHMRKKSLFTASEEDYMEAIYEVERIYGYAKLVDVSNILGVKPSTALSMIRRLEEKGLLIYNRYRGMKLTERGRMIAKKISDSHETIRKFLISIGVDEDTANIEAELIEHFLSRKTLEKLMEFYRECREEVRK